MSAKLSILNGTDKEKAFCFVFLLSHISNYLFDIAVTLSF